MKAMIKTSVIIPVYNTSSYLEECIDSVFSQTQKEIEVIAINDGSTDDSLEVLLCLKKKYPELIIMTQDNHGLGYTRNVGIKKARGQYIYFLDSDDYILEDTLESCYKRASRNGLDVVLFDAFEFEDSVERRAVEPNNCDRHEIIKEEEKVFSGIYFLEKYYQKAYNPVVWLMYCSTAFIKKNEISFLPSVYFEDNEFHCRIMTLAERVMYIPQMFYQYRCRRTSITGADFDLRRARDHIEVVSAIAELKYLNEGRSWHVVKKISLNLLQYVANVCCENALYHEDHRLSEQILNIWMKICGNNIDNTEDLEDIDYIYNQCKLFPDSDLREEKKLIYDKKQQLLIHALEQLPLSQKKNKIAIYGCGKYTDKVLNFYENYVDMIEADIIFLDSYIKDCNTKYRRYPVYPVSEIREMKLDYILISSPKYEEEMNNMIWRLYRDRFTTVLLYSGLHINI